MTYRPAFRLLPSALAGLLGLLAPPALAQTPGNAPVYAFNHLAGPSGGYGNADGTGAAARFTNPTGLATDTAGNVYVADPGAGSVRKISPDGVTTTVLTSDGATGVGPTLNLFIPQFTGVVVAANGDLLITDSFNGVLLKLASSGVLSKYTGQTGLVLYKFVNGPLAQAAFDQPMGLASDTAGNLYVADAFNNVIRKITPQGDVSTFAGTPPEYGNPHGAGVAQTLYHRGSADGPAASAQFAGPTAATVDAAGNVYVADTGNHTIRKVTPAGDVTTLAGQAGQEGSVDGLGAAARFRTPSGIAVDVTGNVYVADTGNGTIRKITPAGAVSTLAGSAGEFATADGTGSAARFVAPKSISLDRSGRLLVGDGYRSPNALDQAGTIRRVTTDGVVTTLAGRGGAQGSANGKGDAARFRHPADVAIDAAGNVFVADDLNHAIRKITPDGTTTTFAGTPGTAGTADGPGPLAGFNRPTGLAFDGSGRLIVADHDNHTIRRIAPDGSVTTLAGAPGVAGSANGTGTAARFHNPVSVAVDADGTIYVGDGDYFPESGDPAQQFATIRKITPAGVVSTLAGEPAVVPYEQTRANFDGTGADARFGATTGITIDPAGNLFVADRVYGRIRKVTSQGVVTSLDLTDATGAAVPARPFIGITRDSSGNLFVTEALDRRVSILPGRALIDLITPAGVLTTAGGSPGVNGSADGAGPAAQFNWPAGLEFDSQGALYVADTNNNAIRKAVLAGPPAIATQPQNATVAAGGNVQFSVTATGVPEPTYQWHFNGAPFQGATASTLSFTNARSTDAGDYTVVVTNALGSVTSAKATLAVTAAPVPPPPAPAGGGGGGAPSVWFLLSLGTLRLLRRFGLRPRWRDRSA